MSRHRRSRSSTETWIYGAFALVSILLLAVAILTDLA